MQTIVSNNEPLPRTGSLEEIVADIGRTIGSLKCAGSQRLVQMGISMTHFHVLTLLRHHDAMPMGRLAEILNASMSSTTGIIDRMEERGLIERTRVPDDRRVVLVSLTATGSELVDQAELVRSEVLTGAMRRLTAPSVARLATALDDLRTAIGEELASAPDRYIALAECDHTHGHHGPQAAGGHHAHRPAPAEGATPAPGPGHAGD